MHTVTFCIINQILIENVQINQFGLRNASKQAIMRNNSSHIISHHLLQDHRVTSPYVF